MTRGVHRHPRPKGAFDIVWVFVSTAAALLSTYYVYDSIGPLAEKLSREAGFSNVEIASLNAVYSVPSIFVGLMGGILLDRVGPRAVFLCTSLMCLSGAVLTALGVSLALMLFGRLLFGLGAEALLVTVLLIASRWFPTRRGSVLLGANLSAARLGSYLADRSPSIAPSLYETDWRQPLWLAAVVAAISVLGAVIYSLIDKRDVRGDGTSVRPERSLVKFEYLRTLGASYWRILSLCVCFYSAIIPFRSTFAVKFFQDARGLSLAEASGINSFVFASAIVAMPAFGYLADRTGRQGLLLLIGALALLLSFLLMEVPDAGILIPTILLGASYSLVPAVLWPIVRSIVAAESLGTAYGLMAMLQNVGVAFGNLVAGYLNDIGGASAAHPEGYALMLSFFGFISCFGVISALLMMSSQVRRDELED